MLGRRFIAMCLIATCSATLYTTRLHNVPVSVKCGLHSETEEYTREAALLTRIRMESWAPKLELFWANEQNQPCIATEFLQHNLAVNAWKYWTIPTLASIGLSVVDALQVLHFQFGHVHAKLNRPENFAIQTTHYGDKIVITDYSEAKRFSPEAGHTDLTQALLLLAYLVDKRFPLDDDTLTVRDICRMVPEELCKVFEFLDEIHPSLIDYLHYEQIAYMFNALILEAGMEFEGVIIWE